MKGAKKMATNKKKNHYYVLVITNDGPKFVTKVNYEDKTAEWNYKEKPLEMEKVWAEDLVLGLNLNFHQAYLVCQKWELESQPYRYEKYKIEWKERKEEQA